MRRTRTRRSVRRRSQHDPETVKAYLTPDQFSLYRLIWNRFVASQMPPATFDETTVDITAGDYLFRVKGTVPKFAGWMATYGLTPGERAKDVSRETADDSDEDDDAVSGVLPPLAEGDRARAEGAPAGTEVHAAAAAVLRSDARQGARGERHRPAEHLRLDHRASCRIAST